jgi:hypothetical protein
LDVVYGQKGGVREDIIGEELKEKKMLKRLGRMICKYMRHFISHKKSTRIDMIDIKPRKRSMWEMSFVASEKKKKKGYKVLLRRSRLCIMALLKYWIKWVIIPTDSFYPHICAFTQ